MTKPLSKRNHLLLVLLTGILVGIGLATFFESKTVKLKTANYAEKVAYIRTERDSLVNTHKLNCIGKKSPDGWNQEQCKEIWMRIVDDDIILNWVDNGI
jgi:hypothetical protein